MRDDRQLHLSDLCGVAAGVRILIREENDMFRPDTDSARQLVRERQADLARDWERLSPPRPPALLSRARRQRRLRLDWLRTHLRPRQAGHAAP